MNQTKCEPVKRHVSQTLYWTKFGTWYSNGEGKTVLIPNPMNEERTRRMCERSGIKFVSSQDLERRYEKLASKILKT